MAEAVEGFVCPACMRELPTAAELMAHFSTEHDAPEVSLEKGGGDEGTRDQCALMLVVV